MNQPRRALLLIAAGLFFFLSLVFWRELFDYMILPTATVVWVLLRMFVFSIDQESYWALLLLLIALAGAWQLIRWLLPRMAGPEIEPPLVSNPALDRVVFWEDVLRSEIAETGVIGTPKSELMKLLTSMYCSQQQGAANYRIEEALRERQIPLPVSLYTFLFARGATAPRRTFSQDPIGFFKQVFRSIRLAPAKLMRRRSGRDAATFRRAVDELLTLMETTLEMKDDVEPTDTPHH